VFSLFAVAWPSVGRGTYEINLLLCPMVNARNGSKLVTVDLALVYSDVRLYISNGFT